MQNPPADSPDPLSLPMPGAALVARPVQKPEFRLKPAAQAVLDKEWARLRDIRSWDESAVAEWDTVKSQAKPAGQKCHLGRVFAICVERNADLPPSIRPDKSRVV